MKMKFFIFDRTNGHWTCLDIDLILEEFYFQLDLLDDAVNFYEQEDFGNNVVSHRSKADCVTLWII